MKKIILALLASLTLCSCKDNLHIVFTDYFVCIKDESGGSSSSVPDNLDNFVGTYYINLISPTLEDAITVDYEVIVGDGLKEGVDFKMQSEARQVKIPRGVNKMPVNIQFFANPVDESKDNTIIIKITGCSDSSINIGYPGPEAKFSSYKVIKIKL